MMQARNRAAAPRLWEQALALYQARKPQEAGAACQALLSVDPGDSEALHYLGLVAFQSGCHADAVRLIERAIQLNPHVAAYRGNLGGVYIHLGQLDAAIAAYLEAVRLDPKFVAAYNYLGGALQKLGRLDEAIVYFRQALALKPDYAEAHFNLGNACKSRGRVEEAVSSYRAAIALKPDYAEAHYNLGNTLKAGGKLDEAVACYRRVLALQQGFVETYINMGLALQERGELDQAMECYRKALSLRPDLAEAHLNAGNVLRLQSRLDEAVACYRDALACNPNCVEAHCNLGVVLSGQGRLEEALVCFHSALLLRPDHAETHNGIGNVAQAQARLEDAVLSYRNALALRPDYAEAHCNLGSVLQLLGKLDEAAEHHRQALTLKPGYAEAHIGLAAVCIDEGRFAAAENEVAQALASAPEHPVAWAMLPSIRKMTPADGQWLDKACSLASGAIFSVKERSTLQYALGKYYDDIGQYDLAFAAYHEANLLQRQCGGEFDRAKLARLVDALIATYTVDFANRLREGASRSECPVLIVGMPRSGTSLAEQIIASHPQAFGAGELPFWEVQALANPPAVLLNNLEAGSIAGMAAEYERLLRQYAPDAARIVDKLPSNFLRLGLIHAVFPQARIIHMQRNPADTCLSIYFQNLNAAHFYGTDLDDLAFFYREYARLMRHWRSVLPGGRLIEVSYEALTGDQAEWSRRMVEFIGLEWDERCLDFHRTERKVGTSSNWQVKQKIYHSSKERWRNYEAHLGPLLDGLGELE